VTVNVDAHSELMGAYPWGSTTPNESTNVPDHGAFQNGALVFTDDGTVGGGVPVHHYAALVASDRTRSAGRTRARSTHPAGDRGAREVVWVQVVWSE
jgi:hypothetical protein